MNSRTNYYNNPPSLQNGLRSCFGTHDLDFQLRCDEVPRSLTRLLNFPHELNPSPISHIQPSKGGFY